MSTTQKLDMLELTWLGTSAGSPGKTRNVSSSALRLDGETRLIDAGEATQHQLQQSKLKASGITKIFLTHMHGDHSFGLVPLMCALADGAGGVVAGQDPRDAQAHASTPLEIYGLTGLRQLIRTTLNCTYTHLARKYRVHELLFERDRPYGGYRNRQELEGRDIWIDREKGCWPNFISEGEKMRVSAVPIQHTVPCVGFVFEEAPRLGNIDPKQFVPLLQKNKEALALSPWNLDNPMKVLGMLQKSPDPITLPDGTVIQRPPLNTNGRKLVILGDTYNAESAAMDELARDADLVVHESTNAFLPGLDDHVKEDDTYESIEKKTMSHGHSTPQIAGRFAKRINAKNLFMNHFSNRYVDAGSTLTSQSGKGNNALDLNEAITVLDTGLDRSREYPSGAAEEKERRILTMKTIEDHATEAWGSGQRAVATRDFMSIAVKRRKG